MRGICIVLGRIVEPVMCPTMAVQSSFRSKTSTTKARVTRLQLPDCRATFADNKKSSLIPVANASCLWPGFRRLQSHKLTPLNERGLCFRVTLGKPRKVLRKCREPRYVTLSCLKDKHQKLRRGLEDDPAGESQPHKSDVCKRGSQLVAMQELRI